MVGAHSSSRTDGRLPICHASMSPVACIACQHQRPDPHQPLVMYFMYIHTYLLLLYLRHSRCFRIVPRYPVACILQLPSHTSLCQSLVPCPPYIRPLPSPVRPVLHIPYPSAARLRLPPCLPLDLLAVPRAASLALGSKYYVERRSIVDCCVRSTYLPGSPGTVYGRESTVRAG